MNISSIPLVTLAFIAGVVLLLRLKYHAWRGTDHLILCAITDPRPRDRP